MPRITEEARGVLILHWFIDAMNVIGSRPDGWWRDRDGAAQRLIDQIRDWAQYSVTVVLDDGPDDLLGTVGTVTVVRASRRGRNAADDEIVRLVEGLDGAVVVTSDAELAARVRALGADVMGARAFLRTLGSPR
jgi:predicted RNA-binding protein with PIN domain